jgi:hypothetical protein
LLILVVTTPVPTLVAVTSTPGSNAPPESETVPVTLAFCANASADRLRASSATAAMTKDFFMTFPPTHPVAELRWQGTYMSRLGESSVRHGNQGVYILGMRSSSTIIWRNFRL